MGPAGMDTGAAGGAVRAADDPSPKQKPHPGQNRACDVLGAPHMPQNFGTAAPHSGQKTALAVSGPPHDRHVPTDDWAINPPPTQQAFHAR